MLVKPTLDDIAENCRVFYSQLEKKNDFLKIVSFIENELEKDDLTKDQNFESFQGAFYRAIAKTLNIPEFLRLEVKSVKSLIYSATNGLPDERIFFDKIYEAIVINTDKQNLFYRYFLKNFMKGDVETFVRVIHVYGLIKYLCFLLGEPLKNIPNQMQEKKKLTIDEQKYIIERIREMKEDLWKWKSTKQESIKYYKQQIGTQLLAPETPHQKYFIEKLKQEIARLNDTFDEKYVDPILSKTLPKQQKKGNKKPKEILSFPEYLKVDEDCQEKFANLILKEYKNYSGQKMAFLLMALMDRILIDIKKYKPIVNAMYEFGFEKITNTKNCTAITKYIYEKQERLDKHNLVIARIKNTLENIQTDNNIFK